MDSRHDRERKERKLAKSSIQIFRVEFLALPHHRSGEHTLFFFEQADGDGELIARLSQTDLILTIDAEKRRHIELLRDRAAERVGGVWVGLLEFGDIMVHLAEGVANLSDEGLYRALRIRTEIEADGIEDISSDAWDGHEFDSIDGLMHPFTGEDFTDSTLEITLARSSVITIEESNQCSSVVPESWEVTI